MRAIESGVLRESAREVRQVLGYPSFRHLAEHMCDVDREINVEDALRYLRNQSVSGPIDKYTVALSVILSAHLDAIVAYYHGQEADHIARFLQSILNKREIKDTEIHKSSNLDRIISYWHIPFARGEGLIASGIYQIFRIYKSATPRANDVTADEDVVICELLYLDPDKMECTLVTAERNIYRGSLYFNHQRILYMILQRPARSSQYSSAYQRVYSALVRGRVHGLYSAICMKTGDTTSRPVGAECLLLYVTQDNHTALYKGMECVVNTSWDTLDVPEDSVITNYITDIPPARPWTEADKGWKRVRRVKDFPFVAELAKKNSHGIVMLKEPIRALSLETMVNTASEQEFVVFRHDKST